jgi:hypothetical protein
MEEEAGAEGGTTKDPALDEDGYLRMSTTSSISDYTPMSPSSPHPPGPPLATLEEDFELRTPTLNANKPHYVNERRYLNK